MICLTCAAVAAWKNCEQLTARARAQRGSIRYPGRGLRVRGQEASSSPAFCWYSLQMIGEGPEYNRIVQTFPIPNSVCRQHAVSSDYRGDPV